MNENYSTHSTQHTALQHTDHSDGNKLAQRGIVASNLIVMSTEMIRAHWIGELGM